MAKLDPKQRVQNELQAWRKDLIDLTRRNQLINLNISGRTSTIEILNPGLGRVMDVLTQQNSPGWKFKFPDPTVDESDFDPDLIDAILAEHGSKTNRTEELETNVPTASKLSQRLRTIASRAESEYLDKGLRVLYLVCGILKWADPDGNEQLSPLVLVPITITRYSPRDPYVLRLADDDPLVNPALAVKLENDHGIILPDMEELDFKTVLARISQDVKRRGWQVEERMAIAVLSFAKETMYKDLLENEDQISNNDMVRALAGDDAGSEKYQIDRIPFDELDEAVEPETLSSILDADATQRACIIAAKTGNSFVIDGPPGSGKSQTISNIICELLADGKTVLFVSEKAAALEVVKKRLDFAGLGEFVLELHSHKATRKNVAVALGSSILKRVEVIGASKLDPIQVARRRRSLSDYAQAVNEFRKPASRTLHDTVGELGALVDFPMIGVPVDFVKMLGISDYLEILDVAIQLQNSWGPVARKEDFLWSDLAQGVSEIPRNQLVALLERLISQAEKVQQRRNIVNDLLLTDFDDSLEGCRRLSQIVAKANPQLSVPPAWLAEENWPDAKARLLSYKTFSEVRDREASALSGISNEKLEGPSKLAEFDKVRTVLTSSGVEQSKFMALTVIQVEDLLRSIDSLVSDLNDIQTLVQALSNDIGLLIPPRSFQDIERLISLSDLIKSNNRPEASWLEGGIIQKVRDALSSVRPLIDQWRTMETRLAVVFNENFRLFNVESLFDSKMDVEPKLSRLNSRGRLNRKQLIACSREGKISQEVLAHLPYLRSWKELNHGLENFGESALLGAYYKGPSTDIKAVEEAVDVAERAVQLFGSQVNESKFGSKIGRDAVGSAALLSRLDEVRNALTSFLAKKTQLQNSLGGAVESSEMQTFLYELDALKTRQLQSIELLSNYKILGSDRIMQLRQRAESHFNLLRADGMLNDLSKEDLIQESGFADDTDWILFDSQIAWVEEIREIFGRPVPIFVANALVSSEASEEMASELSELDRLLTIVYSWFNEPQLAEMQSALGRDLPGCIDNSSYLIESSVDIDEWFDFAKNCAWFKDFGMGELIEYLQGHCSNPSDVEPTVRKNILQTWVDEIMRSDKRLSPKRSLDRDNLREEFRSLDVQLKAISTNRVIDSCNARRPASIFGQAAIINRESDKHNRHMPVKQLLSVAGPTALDIKPCFMMSPLTVSQFLPSEIRFDVVIFDEASQVRPCDAINSIYRGEQLIIAGDERQLPPTSFFAVSNVDDSDVYVEDDHADFESVLKLAQGSAGIESMPLRWHYRSRHESLITFSNQEFYDSELITYPGAVQESDDLGVHFEYVPDGVYLRGSSRDNPVEAEAVIERVLFHARNHPNLSLGVIAFSEAQASRIGYVLDRRRRENPDLDRYFTASRLDGFFIKNLESVQGDERDIIILSVGYGKDEAGKFSMNFGPVNKLGGHRRLNVAITRARQRVEVVASVKASEFTETGSRGVSVLKKYLDFAERGLLALVDIDGSGGEPESPFEVDVLKEIRKMGYDAVPQVGQAGYRIDIGIRNPRSPGTFALAVECDGATYHSSRVARDRDRLRQEVLEGLNWKFHRIWSTSWFLDRAGEISRLQSAIEAALHPVKSKTKAPLVVEKPTQIEVTEVEEVSHSWAVDYVLHVPNVPRGLELDNDSSRPWISKMILEIVSKMKPVHEDVITQILRSAFSVKVMSERRRTNVNVCLAALKSKGEISKDKYGFWWPTNDSQIEVRSGTPSNPASVRKAAHVSPDEVRLAAYWLAADARSIEEPELIRKVAKVFGWQRVGGDIEHLIIREISKLRKDKYLIDKTGADGVNRLETSGVEAPNLD
jgi:hypothetical protein